VRSRTTPGMCIGAADRWATRSSIAAVQENASTAGPREALVSRAELVFGSHRASVVREAYR